MDLKKKAFTLVLITNESRILLGLKKRGMGEGKWNGFGGKVEPEETVKQAAARELFEESALKVQEEQLKLVAILEMSFVDKSEQFEIHVFGCDSDPEGLLVETEEMKPQWFNIDNIPYDQMWSEAAIWFPRFFSGETFKASFIFGNDDELISHRIDYFKEI